jgi:4-diphosphocytidyl-2-C-methyl-D-erythritol kinase
MRGIGERLDPVALPPFWMVLVNPGVPLPTASVYRALAAPDGRPMPDPPRFADAGSLAAFLAAQRNDLEAPGAALAPPVAEARASLAAQRGCMLARMSGSGATCFGLFAAEAPARAAAAAIRKERPGWWAVAAAARR